MSLKTQLSISKLYFPFSCGSHRPVCFPKNMKRNSLFSAACSPSPPPWPPAACTLKRCGKKVTNGRRHVEEVFPFDVIYEILLRLPATSLIRFRCVCKKWCDIIDSFSFANEHVSARSIPAADEPQIVPMPSLAGDEKALHSFICDIDLLKQSEHPVLEFYDQVVSRISVIAHGLVLFFGLADPGKICLCNPLRGEILELPRPRAVVSHHFAEELTCFGIGFDSATNTYKIVRAYAQPLNDEIFHILSFDKFEVEVYTLGTHSWRPVSLQVPFSPRQPSVSAYGDTHWLNRDRRSKKDCLISFDFETEEFKETHPPQFGYHQHYKDFQLANVEGCLAIVSYPSDTLIDIWMLKDYANKKREYWIREYRISTRVWTKQPDDVTVGVVRPDICFWEDKDDFFINTCSCGLVFTAFLPNQTFVLELKTRRIWHVDCPFPQMYRCFRGVSNYTGTALSLRYFGNNIERSQKYSSWKTVQKVYVSPQTI